MSKIGRNIRKIRSLKGLNQSEFAEIFDLKRASIGAYEEGRAEPKIANVVEIANYFGISIDDLLLKELSVNDFYRFDLFREELQKDARHNLKPIDIPVEVIAVPFVSQVNKSLYLKDRKNLSGLASLYLPLPKGENYRAFELVDDAMLRYGAGPSAKDIVVAVRPNGFDASRLAEGKLYLFETKTEILLRKFSGKSLSQFKLEPFNPDFYPCTLQQKEIVEVWQLKTLITKNISAAQEIGSRLSQLESALEQLKNKLNP